MPSRSAASATPATARAGVPLMLAALVSSQLGFGTSVLFLGDMNPLGATWLRFAWAAVILLAVVRPWRFRYTRAALGYGLLLGFTSAGMGVSFMAAAFRLPLGTASAIEFLGPLALAILSGRGAARWVWPALAAVGVALLTRPWSGEIDGLGVLFALAGAVFYAGYIFLTQRVGDHASGVQGLGISLPVAAVLTTVVAAPITWPELQLRMVWLALLPALLVPLLPFVLELLALRRITTAAFSTLTCLEPAAGLLVGLVLLAQVPDLIEVAGLVAVVIAGLGAVRGGGRAQVSAPEDPVRESCPTQ